LQLQEIYKKVLNRENVRLVQQRKVVAPKSLSALIILKAK